jgi:hypothetical protein
VLLRRFIGASSLSTVLCETQCEWSDDLRLKNERDLVPFFFCLESRPQKDMNSGLLQWYTVNATTRRSIPQNSNWYGSTAASFSIN